MAVNARTSVVSGSDVAKRIRRLFGDAVIEVQPDWVVVEPSRLLEVARFLRDDEELDCKYLASLSAVDRLDHFEVVYHLASLAKNHAVTVKTVARDHDAPQVPSLVPVWHGAHLQEREAYDLMGITFAGHPQMKRIFLWEGFPGHPLRKDFMTLPGGFKPGLQRFPKEVAGETGGEFRPELGGTALGDPRRAD